MFIDRHTHPLLQDKKIREKPKVLQTLYTTNSGPGIFLSSDLGPLVPGHLKPLSRHSGPLPDRRAALLTNRAGAGSLALLVSPNMALEEEEP